MSKVTADISMSLDGFVAGPNDGPELPLGAGGERLHEWMYGLASYRERHGLGGGETNRDAEVLEETFKNVGGVIVGRRIIENAGGWGDDPPFHMPVFVLTHEAREPLVKDGGTTFTFVTDGFESALSQAKAAAGNRDVSIGGGVRLFEHLGTDQIALERTRVIDSPSVTHLKFRAVKERP